MRADSVHSVVRPGCVLVTSGVTPPDRIADAELSCAFRPGWLTGRIEAGIRNGTKFHAFRVLLNSFIGQQDLGMVIEEQTVCALNNLPDL